MSPIAQSILIIGLQVVIYIVFLRPRILTWGTSKAETSMPLFGDDLASGSTSTRAITINASIAEVWQTIIQLGADRGGFFSYAFIEKLLGYEMHEAEDQSTDMEMGRIVPGSVDESKSVIKYNFRVTAVDPGKAYVLEDWGAFVLIPVNDQQTRLILRNHKLEQPNLLGRIADFFMVPLHYIMERRMMIGFKAQAEGVRLSAAADNAWILGLILSGIGIASMIFISTNILTTALATIYSTLWLLILLIFAPRPRYSLSLLLFIAATIVWLLMAN